MVCALPHTGPPVTFGEKAGSRSTRTILTHSGTGDSGGAFLADDQSRSHAPAKRCSTGISAGCIDRTPFKIGTELTITLDKTTSRIDLSSASVCPSSPVQAEVGVSVGVLLSVRCERGRR
jgi:hypothetical protein